jgi:hypothetical protein
MLLRWPHSCSTLVRACGNVIVRLMVCACGRFAIQTVGATCGAANNNNNNNRSSSINVIDKCTSDDDNFEHSRRC